MSLAAILTAIEAEGEAEATRLRAEAEADAQRTLAEAERLAAAQREAARSAAAQVAAGERARRLHQARLETLRARGELRDRLIDAAMAAARQRLSALRDDPAYPRVLRRLLEEAVAALGDEPGQGRAPRLEIDPRDEALVRSALSSLGLDWPVETGLSTWGGAAARSADGRIVATNTLEARFERARSLLRQDAAAFIEQGLDESREPADIETPARVPSEIAGHV